MSDSADKPSGVFPATAARKVYSVAELTRKIKLILEEGFPSVWVEGEISGFKKHQSGHMYFTLKDEAAVIKAVFFSRYNQGLRFDLHDGLKVVCYGKISLYEVRGEYQVYVERIEPKGLGELQLALEQLKARLHREGFFDPARKRPIPSYPRKIGIVTSPTGAAIRDMMNVLGRRFHGIHILICPVRVQGEGSAEEIARGIEDLNRLPDIDVLIVGRGGGSLEDLWAFNEERVVRAIYHSRIPVISAVGHEVDWTLADFAADLRAPTPSAAAELVTKSRGDLETRIDELTKRAGNAIRNCLEDRRNRLESLTSSYAFRQPLSLVDGWFQRLDERSKQLAHAIRKVFSLSQARVENLAGKLEALSPVAVLARGYSLTLDAKGKVLKRTEDLKKGGRIRTYLHQGAVESEITGIFQTENFTELRDDRKMGDITGDGDER